MVCGIVEPCGCGDKICPTVVGGRRAEWPIACNDAQAAAKDWCEEGACAKGVWTCPDKPLIEVPLTN